MAIAMLAETAGMTEEQYTAILAELPRAEACSVHVAGPSPDDSGWRVFTVWESLEAAQAFVRDELSPSMTRHGVDWQAGGPPQSWPVSNVILTA